MSRPGEAYPVAGGTKILVGGSAASRDPMVLLVASKERCNEVFLDGLALDGYRVSRAGDRAALGAWRSAAPVDLVVLSGAPDQRASLDVLRALRAGGWPRGLIAVCACSGSARPRRSRRCCVHLRRARTM